MRGQDVLRDGVCMGNGVHGDWTGVRTGWAQGGLSACGDWACMGTGLLRELGPCENWAYVELEDEQG